MKNYLEYYYKKYPKSEIQDYLKLIFQSTFGPGHMIENPSKSLSYLKDEILSLHQQSYEDLYDVISDDYVRINLRVYQKYNLSLNYLNENFLNTANLFLTSVKNINHELDILSKFLIEKGYGYNEVNEKITEFINNDYPMQHHSSTYQELYKPAYRLIHKKFLNEEIQYYQLRHYLNQLPKNEISFIAIDGKSCSGKTTLATLLSKENDVTIIHVDDFFDNATSEIGINSKRIINEIFMQSNLNKSLKYNKFDCSTKTYKEVLINKVNPIVIIEGVYSSNHELEHFYTGIVYIETCNNTQIERLSKRSKHLLNRFINEWIPRENRYFVKQDIYNRADIIVIN